jgi:Mg/Co/Ni transporter MgtE
MPTVRDVMTTDYAWIGGDESVHDAAERLAKLNLPAIPVCSADRELMGMLSSRATSELVEDKSTCRAAGWGGDRPGPGNAQPGCCPRAGDRADERP